MAGVPDDRTTDEKMSAFLDTNVIVDYLKNRGAAAQIFDQTVASHVRYAINPIVMQELLLISKGSLQSKVLEMINEHLLVVLDMRSDLTEEYLDKARQLRNKIVHTNDVLILSNASECDYLVTNDKEFFNLAQDGRPVVVTPEQFIAQALRIS